MKKFMRSGLLILIVIINISLFNSIYAQSILNYSLNDIEGNETKLSEIKGKNLTVIDFWATWCKPCLNFIPKLIDLSAEYDSLNVKFIGINVDSPRNYSKVKPMSYSLGITYPVLLDGEQELMTDFMINLLPTLFIVNNKGEVIYRHTGYIAGDENIIKKELNKLLNEK